MHCVVAKFVMIVTLAVVSEGLDLARCRVALGMQTREIPDHAIRASSSLNHSNVGPASARVRTEINGGAWCPKEHVAEDVYEFLQIDFSNLKVITLVETQGRFGNGQGQEYVEQYTLEYQREAEGPWFKFSNRRGQKIFQGNTNTYIAELREVDPPIIAKAIRFVPYSQRPKPACLRVEVYGCRWKDDILWYNMPQGERRSSEVEFEDSTYDGTEEENYLKGGLGQLTDGDFGQSNFRLDLKNLGIKGYEWVGWKNDSFTNNLVKMIFKFDTMRNFSRLTLHCSNSFSKDIRIFRSALMSFSESEKFFPVPSIDYRHTRDLTTENARSIIIPLNNAVGSHVKLELFFDSRWILISEVQFESELAKEVDFDHLQLTTDGLSLLAAVDMTAYHSLIEVVDVVLEKEKDTVTKETPPHNLLIQTTTKLLESSPLNDFHSEKILNTSTVEKKVNDEYIGIIIGMLLVVAIILIAVILLLVLRHRRQKYANGHQVMKCVEPRHVAVTMNSLRNSRTTLSNGKVNNGNIYDFVATSDVDSDQARSCCGGISNMVEFYQEVPERLCQLSELSRAPDISASIINKEYSFMDILEKPLEVSLPATVSNSSVKNSWSLHMNSFNPKPTQYHGTLLRPLNSTGLNALHRLPHGTNECISTSTGASAYRECPRKNNQILPENHGSDFSLAEFSLKNLKFVKKLSDWQFGEVHICSTVVMDNSATADPSPASRTLSLIVKMTQIPADKQMKMEFRKEVGIMSQLRDDNIIQLLGICSTEEPMCVIYEHLKYGDLKKFLQRHTIDCISNEAETVPSLSHGTLIYMASQIASGMKHLEMLNIVHRDLSARNCQVGDNYTVKVSDLGTSCNIYREDYYLIDDKIKLPIRWMSWESLILNQSSCKSDVWSFGVTMWEILLLAKEKPFSNMTDHQVLENHSHYYAGDGKESCPPQPGCCPREIYDLLRECWNRDEAYRPTFREIHMFLQRKNMGYSPHYEEQRQLTASSVLV